MGFSGILASLAQGLGGGMVKVADEAYKQASQDKQLSYLAEQKALDRQHEREIQQEKFNHDKELEGIKHKNAITQLATKARLDRQASQDSDNSKAINEAHDSIKAIEFNQVQIAKIDEALANGAKSLTEEGKQKLIAEKKRLEAHNQAIANNAELQQKIAQTGSQALLAQWQTTTTPYLSTAEPPPPALVAPPPAVGKVGEVSKTGEPNVIDATDTVALEKALKAQKERDAQKRLYNAIAHGREIASKHSSNPYVQLVNTLGR